MVATNDAMSEVSPASPGVSTGTMSSESTPRLLITKMELENFKSYAGVREIGPFHKCFSAVVGPNGSGKSNVIDAMLFVFGKRAKQLRLNKVSELIHKSAAVKDDPPTFARVSVYLQDIVDTGPGDDDYRLIPGTECVISRIARTDNSSTYKINGKNAQFKEVAALLASKGVDLDNNRFLILQGEVEMISMMPPKGKTENDEGLLEYLEDIIGSSKFVEETNQAAEKMEQLNEVRQEKLNRVKAVEKEKDSLQSAKLEAEALLSKEREIRRKQNILYQINAMKAQTEIEYFTDKCEKVNEKLEAERQKMKESNDRVKEIEDALVEQRKEYDTIYEELTTTKEEFAAYERRDIKLREDIKYNKNQKKKLEAKVAAEEKKLTTATSKVEEATESVPRLEKEIESLNEQKVVEDAKAEEMYEQNKEELNKLRAELQVKTQELAPIQQERAIFQASLDTAETELKLLEESSTQAKEKLEAAEKELASLDETKDSKRQELVDCEEELQKSKDRVVEAEAEEKVLAEKEQQLAKRSKDLLARSEEAKAALQSKGGDSQSPAIKGILKAAVKGGELSKAGILGRLGDLATIPEEYDVAVSTCCSMLDHIVVQTTAGAQRCLEFLRKHGLGRANFIPLDKMKKGAHDRVVETPENAPRLFELITPINFAAGPAIFLAVGDTLVAPDLETATRWAYEYNKRWRVVTVDGKLIEATGTMSGGGNSVRRGKMKLSNGKKSVPVVEQEDESNDCQSLEEEAAKAQALLTELRQRRKDLATEIKELKKTIKALEKKLPKLTIELDGFETTRENLTASIPELRKKCEVSKSDEKIISELRQKVSKCKSDMASCAMQASKLEAEVARMQKGILEVGGPRYKKQKDRCEKIVSDLAAAEKALSSAKVAITSSEKAIAKATEAKKAAEEELAACIALYDEKKKEFKALEEDAVKVMQAFENVKAVEAEKREALDLFAEEVEELKKSQSGAKVVEIELAGQLDAHKKQIVESEKKKHHWEQEIEKLVSMSQQYDEFDESDDEEDEKMEEASSEDADGEVPEKEQVKKSESKSSLPTLSGATLEKYDAAAVREDISVLEAERNTIAKNANMSAIAEYRKKEADYLAKVEELDAVTEERNAIRRTYEDLRRKRLEMFMDGFGHITLKLKEMYQMITLGGDAELELVDSLDPFSEGIVFSVRPPKKSWKNISNLSGGEKTLSSLALVFALHHFKPTPLYVMDEIDAALDFKNVSIVANYIKERTKNAQFIIISLRNNMFELADRLVGIYKTNNCTKSVTINPRAFGVDSEQDGAMTPALKERTNNKRSHSSSVKESSSSRQVSFSSESVEAA